jgi:anion-transporting  ArsA/GET3 family ATPase
VRAIVVTGAGGVGKTTVAAAIAATAARAGERTLVSTVDPARRLADALDLEELSDDPHPTPLPNLDACMLDASSSWHRVIRRHAPPDAADRLEVNPYFEAIANRFPAGQAYAAAEQMATFLESGKWDLVVVDTPPADGGIDFFAAPGRIRNLIGGRLLRWVTGASVPGRRRLYRFTAAPALRLIDTVLGGPLLQEVAEFLLDLRTAYDGISRRARQIDRRLADASVVVVTTAEPAALAEADRFYTTREAPQPAGVVFNRSLPEDWADADADGPTELVENLRRWGAEALRQRHAREAFAARHDQIPVVVPWLAQAPTGIDDLTAMSQWVGDLV